MRAEVVRQLGGTAVASRAVGGERRRGWPPEEDLHASSRLGAGIRVVGEMTGSPVRLLVFGWLLFALALGVGIVVGWAIWSS